MLFALTAALTARWSAAMSAMTGMPMPGGWTMSMTWMRMPGQTWLSCAASFLVMWVAMMVAMMLPSLAPALCRYYASVAPEGNMRAASWALVLGAAYFFVWTMLGGAIFPAGAILAAIEMRHALVANAVPVVGGVLVLLAGALQFTAWKAHHLACCRDEPSRCASQPSGPGPAARQGLRLGLHCLNRCASLTAVLLVIGVMDVRAMAAVTVAITLERFAPQSERVAQAIGAVTIGLGLFLLVRAAG